MWESNTHRFRLIYLTVDTPELLGGVFLTSNSVGLHWRESTLICHRLMQHPEEPFAGRFDDDLHVRGATGNAEQVDHRLTPTPSSPGLDPDEEAPGLRDDGWV